MTVFEAFLLLLLLFGPIGLILGWVSFALSYSRQEWPCRKILPNLAVSALCLATASALLAFFYNPRSYSPKTFEIGLSLSIIGLLVGIVGTYGTGSLRWYAPLSSVGIAVYWLLTTIAGL
jgi:hypothetical protein